MEFLRLLVLGFLESLSFCQLVPGSWFPAFPSLFRFLGIWGVFRFGKRPSATVTLSPDVAFLSVPLSCLGTFVGCLSLPLVFPGSQNTSRRLLCLFCCLIHGRRRVLGGWGGVTVREAFCAYPVISFWECFVYCIGIQTMNHCIGIQNHRVASLTCEVCDFSLPSTTCASPHLLTPQSGTFRSANGETPPFCGNGSSGPLIPTSTKNHTQGNNGRQYRLRLPTRSLALL